MLSVGVMQGRLLPPYEGRFQAFPAATWREEFRIGQKAGVACIEWIYEEPHQDQNPIATPEGRAAMRQIAAETGVAVRSVCADYFMTARLINRDGSRNPDSVARLRAVLDWSADLGITYVVLPFVDISTVASPPEWDALIALLKEFAPLAESRRVELHLETSLPPRLFAHILRQVNSPWVRANYDSGNSAALGYDQRDELRQLRGMVGSCHIKDRVLGGRTVPLSTGNCDFDAVFGELRIAGFDRWFILQAARGEAGQEGPLAIANIAFVTRGWTAARAA
ncbi:MAG: hypothetical protein RL328_2872 [Acidobacteriota bacterium]|jgi:hexulose-6-phosphate isomerase